jgi:hypothetical protein
MSKIYGEKMRSAARSCGSWLKRKRPRRTPEIFRSLKHSPAYVKAISKQWNSILFGEGVLGVIFLLWWALGTPPLALIFASAAIVAGFFVWCAEYVKSLPKISVVGWTSEQAEARVGASVGTWMWIQIQPKCLTDAPVTCCKAHLITVFRKTPDCEWQPTGKNEASFLKWSVCENEEITLEPKAEMRINVCISESMSDFLRAEHIPSRARNDFVITNTLSFDIKITGNNCPPVFVSLEVSFTQNKWNKPSCVLRNHLTLEKPTPV